MLRRIHSVLANRNLPQASGDGVGITVEFAGCRYLINATRRPSTATAIEDSSVIRLARSLFQRVLESDPAAARRLRDEFAKRTSQIASDILMASGKLST